MQFLYQFSPIHPGLENSALWDDVAQQAYEGHVAHLQQGATNGTVILAGRCQDGIGPAIVIIETESEAAARAFMQADPFVSNGVCAASLHPYLVAFARA